MNGRQGELQTMEHTIRQLVSGLHIGYHGGGMLFWKWTRDGEIQILLGRRLSGTDGGKWCLPGGSWEKTDGFSADGKPDYHRTALRTAHRETGYAIPEQDDITCIWSIHAPFFHTSVFTYRMREEHVCIEFVTERFSEGGWFDIHELPEPLEYFLPLQLHQFRKKLHRLERLRNSSLLM